MSKQGKIEKWNLEDEVIRLKEEGKGSQSIAQAISLKYNDIPELRDISHMSVVRFIERFDEMKMEDRMEENKDPTKAIAEEFNIKMRESILDAEKARQTINSYMVKLKTEPESMSSSDVQKIISSWQKINDQYRKNLVSLREFADNRIIRPTQNIIYKKEINIKNLLLEISRDLCQNCRNIIKEKLEEEK
jgi:hypothetical protein